MGTRALIAKNRDTLKKHAESDLRTLLNPSPSFAQRSQTHQSMQNYQGYPLMTSIVLGKPSLLLRSPKNSGKPSVEVIKPLLIPCDLGRSINGRKR